MCPGCSVHFFQHAPVRIVQHYNQVYEAFPLRRKGNKENDAVDWYMQPVTSGMVMAMSREMDSKGLSSKWYDDSEPLQYASVHPEILDNLNVWQCDFGSQIEHSWMILTVPVMVAFEASRCLNSPITLKIDNKMVLADAQESTLIEDTNPAYPVRRLSYRESIKSGMHPLIYRGGHNDSHGTKEFVKTIPAIVHLDEYVKARKNYTTRPVTGDELASVKRMCQSKFEVRRAIAVVAPDVYLRWKSCEVGNAQLLFHGCPSTALASIAHTGFDLRYANHSVTAPYGIGTSFATRFEDAHQFVKSNENKVVSIYNKLYSKTFVGCTSRPDSPQRVERRDSVQRSLQDNYCHCSCGRLLLGREEHDDTAACKCIPSVRSPIRQHGGPCPFSNNVCNLCERAIVPALCRYVPSIIPVERHVLYGLVMALPTLPGGLGQVQRLNTDSGFYQRSWIELCSYEYKMERLLTQHLPRMIVENYCFPYMVMDNELMRPESLKATLINHFGADPTGVDIDGWFHSFSALKDRIDINGYIHLHIDSEFGDATLLKHWLSKLDKWNTLDVGELNLWFTTLVNNGKVDAARIILEYKADVHYLRDRALLSACARGNTPLVKMLVEHGADVNVNANRPIYCASRVWNAECVELLIKAKADVNIPDGFPIVAASEAKSTTCVELLLKNRADPNAQNGMPILNAARAENWKMMQVLVKYGAKMTDSSMLLMRAKGKV